MPVSYPTGGEALIYFILLSHVYSLVDCLLLPHLMFSSRFETKEKVNLVFALKLVKTRI